jgi:hypothetical protein
MGFYFHGTVSLGAAAFLAGAARGAAPSAASEPGDANVANRLDGSGHYLLRGVVWCRFNWDGAAKRNSASAPPKAKETELANAAPKIEPLPSGAKFRRGEHVFYYVREPYTPKEAADILEICEELDNYLQVKFLPIIGSLQEYTKSKPQNIKLIGGPKSAQTHIHDIDVTLLIPAYEAMTPIIGKYPTHREAINEFLLDKGEFGSMRGDMHAFEQRLRVLPDDADAQLLDATAGAAQTKFLDGIQKFMSWIGGFHQGLERAKPELRLLINRRI